MYYIGFLKKDARYAVVFKSIVQPKKTDYTYFVKVIGPYPEEEEARRTLRDLKHVGYRENPATESRAQYCRERQVSPGMFDKRSFRTITLGASGKKGVIGCIKEQYRRGKCGVGTRLQTILHPVGSERCPTGGLELRKRTRNPIKGIVRVMGKTRAIALTKRLIKLYGKIRQHNPVVSGQDQRFRFYLGELQKYVVGSRLYIETLAKAYEQLKLIEQSMRS